MKRLIGLTAVGVLVAGCAQTQGLMHGATGPAATATLEATKGNSTAGTVTFASKGDKVVVIAKVSGLSPGSHAFHVHEKGDCSSGDGMSAGAHFNPEKKPHGPPTSKERHTGDMPMLVADASGNASLTTELDIMTVGSGSDDIVGKAVIVHKDPDDYGAQPAGNAGARVACGIIKKA